MTRHAPPTKAGLSQSKHGKFEDAMGIGNSDYGNSDVGNSNVGNSDVGNFDFGNSHFGNFDFGILTLEHSDFGNSGYQQYVFPEFSNAVVIAESSRVEPPTLNIIVVSLMMVFSSCVPTSGSIANCIGRDVACCALGSVPIPDCVTSFQWSPQ